MGPPGWLSASGVGPPSASDGTTCQEGQRGDGLEQGPARCPVEAAHGAHEDGQGAFTEWAFGPQQAASISHPVLSVHGSKTQPLWVEVADFLRSSLPKVEDCTIEGVGHLLHIERPEPVGKAIEQFLGRNPIASGPPPIL
jgi:pimeloyl-ACP methyl ester carboxylesterase